tara:strand:- start:15930 stop:16124 length:195 start_codon:yes stop_codon:yes gene_type:complete
VKKRLNKILEITWLLIGISSIVALVYYYLDGRIEDVKPLLFIVPVSVLFYISRRRRGKKMDSEE